MLYATYPHVVYLRHLFLELVENHEVGSEVSLALKLRDTVLARLPANTTNQQVTQSIRQSIKQKTEWAIN